LKKNKKEVEKLKNLILEDLDKFEEYDQCVLDLERAKLKIDKHKIESICSEVSEFNNMARNEEVHNSNRINFLAWTGLTLLIVSALSGTLTFSQNFILPIALFAGASAFLGFFFDTIRSDRLLKENKEMARNIITKITNDS